MSSDNKKFNTKLNGHIDMANIIYAGYGISGESSGVNKTIDVLNLFTNLSGFLEDENVDFDFFMLSVFSNDTTMFAMFNLELYGPYPDGEKIVEIPFRDYIIVPKFLVNVDTVAEITTVSRVNPYGYIINIFAVKNTI